MVIRLGSQPRFRKKMLLHQKISKLTKVENWLLKPTDIPKAIELLKIKTRKHIIKPVYTSKEITRIKSKTKKKTIIQNNGLPRLNKIKTESIKPIDISKGLMLPKESMEGTICDPNLEPNGFILCLPRKVKVTISDDDDGNIEIDEIIIPEIRTRKYWQHSSGLYSLDTIGRALNFIIYCAYKKDNLLDNAVNSYFGELVRSLSTKKGEIAQLGMAVRYPHSVKATATMSTTLPPNTIEIHTTMATQLGVKNDDVVLVERFPCLGFMSLRPQYIRVTNDEQCKFVVRVSKNSLISLNLDFDGDVLYIASFKTKKANKHLRKLLMDGDFSYTNKIINKINNKKEPRILDGGFDVCNVITFPTLTKEMHHTIVKRATGVKAHTGPVIALAYNLMRLVEGCISEDDNETHASIEVLLDILGNSVFSQKHGIKSLQEEATDAICTADCDKMVELGFERKSSKVLCDIIANEAKTILNITGLKSYHANCKKKGGSNIISLLIRTKHKLYFASRAILPPYDLYTSTRYNDNDIPSFMFKTFQGE